MTIDQSKENSPSWAVINLLEDCPFLESYRDEYWDCGETLIFGRVAGLIMDGTLNAAEQDAVFEAFNHIAVHGCEEDVTILATGAIEMFNDDANSQRLAREKLKGEALQILEDMKIGWGQPDYEAKS